MPSEIKLGTLQTDLLQALGRHGGEWYRGSQWTWGATSKMEPVFRALVKKGFVEERDNPETTGMFCSSPIFRMTRLGREWYFETTKERVERFRFAKFTEPYEEGEFHQPEPIASAETSAIDQGDVDYAVPADGIHGWTVSTANDRNDVPVIGDHKVWWVMKWGPEESKLKAERFAEWLNENRFETNSHAVAVPLGITSLPKTVEPRKPE
jgi:hypothetical protein